MNTLRAFHNIVSDQSLSYESKVNRLLDFGLQLFGLDVAIVSQIEGDEYKVLYAESDIPELKPGLKFELADTYCIHTLSANCAKGFHHVGKSEIAAHPCYEKQQLEAYLGAPIHVNGRVFGTVNFSASAPVEPFDSSDFDYVELIAQWLGAEMARNVAFEKLALQAQTLEQLESVGNIGTWLYDVASDNLQWSKQTRLIHEVDDDFIPSVQSAIEFYVAGDNRDNITAVVKNAIKYGESWSVNAQIITQRGHLRWVMAKGEVKLKHGQCVKIFGTFQDITESVTAAQKLREAKESAERASLVKSEFLANMSHEIRTPMNGVLGTLQVLSSANIDAGSQQLIDKAVYSARSLITIINDILDYSKIEANQLSLESKPFSMLEVTKSVVSDLSEDADSKDIELTTETVSSFNDNWQGDMVRVRQILLNLVSNAVKFTHQGHVKITLKNATLSSDEALQLVVSDSGIGMSEAFQKQIFERFTQADSSTTRKYGGTGLGMSITLSLIEMMGGTIQVSSKEGKGTIVIVTLPLKAVLMQPRKTTEHDNTPPNLMGKRILVAEDNDINRLVVGSMLTTTNAIVDYAENGLQAVEAFKTNIYHLVLMDIQMPELDGIGAFKRMQEINNEVPVVALTANVFSEDIETYLELGFIGHIGKPVDMMLLYATLNNLLTEVVTG